jgi:hypothetical protein
MELQIATNLLLDAMDDIHLAEESPREVGIFTPRAEEPEAALLAGGLTGKEHLARSDEPSLTGRALPAPGPRVQRPRTVSSPLFDA